MVVLRVAVLFAVLLVAAVLLAPFTQPGSRVLLGALDRYTPLEVTYGSGSLAGVLQIERLALDSAGIELQMRDISTELALGCLWRSAVCFRRLHIGVLEIDMPAGPADASAPVPETTAGPGSDGEMLVFPVALEARSLVIDRTRVGWPDGEWRQGGASLQVHIRESTVEVSRALVRAARLELREPAVAAAAPQDSIALPRIDLPLVLRVYDLQLQDPAWSVFGMQQQFEQLQLQGQWRHTQLSLEQFSAARAGWGEMTLRGSLQFAGDWPLSATAQLAIDRPPSGPACTSGDSISQWMAIWRRWRWRSQHRVTPGCRSRERSMPWIHNCHSMSPSICRAPLALPQRIFRVSAAGPKGCSWHRR